MKVEARSGNICFWLTKAKFNAQLVRLNCIDRFEAIDVSTGKCGIVIDNGGLLNIGGQWSERATLRIPNGSIVRVKNGGKIYINNYSEIIVEEGGQLIVENGGKIYLKGRPKITVGKGGKFIVEEGASIIYWKSGQNEARVIVEGELRIIKTNSKAPALFSGGGRIVFEKYGQISIDIYKDLVNKEGLDFDFHHNGLLSVFTQEHTYKEKLY